MAATKTSLAKRLGREAGQAAGSWMLDGNSTREQAQAILDGYEDGDPEIMDLEPSPLSGEWADSPTPQTLAYDLGVTDPTRLDELCSLYESAFTDGFWTEVLRAAKVYAS